MPASDICYFYSRPCGRGDAVVPVMPISVWIFLLTPLREGRLVQRRIVILGIRISTHAPAGGATSVSLYAGISTAFLLTPLREGRRSRTCCLQNGRSISTHAPAGGATSSASVISSCGRIFLLTPLREGRRKRRRSFVNDRVFLLTPLREGRLIGFTFNNVHSRISTHAPAGGATQFVDDNRVGV